MKVSELIGFLEQMPADAPVWLHWDGSLRTEAEVVWNARSGAVGIGEADYANYSDDDRTAESPGQAENRYLDVGDMPGALVIRSPRDDWD